MVSYQPIPNPSPFVGSRRVQAQVDRECEGVYRARLNRIGEPD